MYVWCCTHNVNHYCGYCVSEIDVLDMKEIFTVVSSIQ